jgi:hypothetical protein
MLRVSEIFERFERMFYKFVCSTFWGLGLMDKQRMVGLDRLHGHISKNRNVKKSQGGREQLGCFQTFLLASALRAGASGLIQWSGEAEL